LLSTIVEASAAGVVMDMFVYFRSESESGSRFV
jgi:hypothetical protein